MRGISQAIRQLAWSRGSNLAFFFVRLSSEFANRKIQTSNIVYKVIRSEPFVVVGRGCRKPWTIFVTNGVRNSTSWWKKCLKTLALVSMILINPDYVLFHRFTSTVAVCRIGTGSSGFKSVSLLVFFVFLGFPLSVSLGLQGTRRSTASRAGWADGSSPLFEWGRSGVTASYFSNLHETSCHFVVWWLGWIHFVATVSFIFFYYVSGISWPPSLGLCILVSKEPGDQQLPKQDEPMEAVPCSPRGNGEEWGHCFLLHLSSWGFMSFCSMLTWLDAFCSNGLFYILLLFFCISWLPSLGLCILVSKEPGERQLPKQDEPMDKSPVKAVPCSPGGNGGGVGSLLPTSLSFMRLHVIL